MQDRETATILAFPARSKRQENVSAKSELVQLAENLTALAAAMREFKTVTDDLLSVLQNRIVDAPHD